MLFTVLNQYYNLLAQLHVLCAVEDRRGTAAYAAYSLLPAGRVLGENDRVRFGLIGAGGQRARNIHGRAGLHAGCEFSPGPALNSSFPLLPGVSKSPKTQSSKLSFCWTSSPRAYSPGSSGWRGFKR